MSCGKAVVNYGLWKNFKLFGSNKYKTYLPPISIFLETTVKLLSIFTIQKVKSQKLKGGSKMFSKMYYKSICFSS